MLAMVYCFQIWRCYLDGTQVIVHTDHESLTWLQTQPRPSHRQARWLEYLSRFQFKVAYIRGDKNIVADALSRMLHPVSENEEPLPADNWPCTDGNIMDGKLMDGNNSNPKNSEEVLTVFSHFDLTFRSNRPSNGRTANQAAKRNESTVSLNRDREYGQGKTDRKEGNNLICL